MAGINYGGRAVFDDEEDQAPVSINYGGRAVFDDAPPAPATAPVQVLTAARPTLAERFTANRDDAFNSGTLMGAGVNFAARKAADGVDPAMAVLERERQIDEAEQRRNIIGAGGIHRWQDWKEPRRILEAGTDVAGALVGSLLTPENLVSAPAKLFGWAGKPVLGAAARGALGGAVTNAATDPAVQALNIEGGTQERYDPKQTALSAVIGAVAGGALGGAEAGAKRLGERRAARRAASGEIPQMGGGEAPIDYGGRAQFDDAPANSNIDYGGRAQFDDFPGDRDLPSGTDAANLPDFTGGRPKDLTDRALDVLRSGEKVKVDDGPTLIEWLSKNGGLLDQGGELTTLDADRWHRDKPFRTRLIQEGGMPLERAAERAQDAGYITPLLPDGSNRATTADLLDGIQAELAGWNRVSREDPDAVELRQRVQDLDEILVELGMDPAKHSNDDIRAAMDDYFRTPQQRLAAQGPPPDKPSSPDIATAPETPPQPGGVSRSGGVESRAYPAASRDNWYSDADFESRGGRPVEMTPDEYLGQVRPLEIDDVSRDNIDDLKAHIEQGRQLDPLKIYADGKEDGRHRAHAAKELGIQRVPVIDFRPERRAALAPEIDFTTPGARDARIGDTTISYQVSRDGPVEISMVRTPAELRGRGSARAAVQAFLAEADRAGRAVALTPDPMERGISKGRLVDFYRSEGFRPNAGRTRDFSTRAAMLREPRITLPEGKLEARSTGPSARDTRLVLARHGARIDGEGVGGPRIAGLEDNWDGAVQVLRHLKAGDAVGVLHHPAVGRIDVIWGDKRGGLAHILAKPNGEQLVRDLPEVLASSTVTPGGTSRVFLENPTHKTVVVLDYLGQEKRWLLTAYEKGKGGQSSGGRIDSPAAEGPAIAAPQGGSPDRLADLNIRPDLPDGKLSAQGERLEQSTRPADAPRPTPRAVPDPRHIERLEHSLTELTKKLGDTLGLTVRQGRMTPSRPGTRKLGEYSPSSGVIRTRAKDMDVLAHEATHALEYQKHPALLAALARNAPELKRMAPEGYAPEVHRQEGFAEFGRYYLTDPETAKQKAPTFYAEFEAALVKDAPKVLNQLRAIQNAYQGLLKAPSASLARSIIVRSSKPTLLREAGADVKTFGIQGAMEKWGNELYRRAIDDLHPINMAVRQLLDGIALDKGKRLDLKAAENPYALARMSRGAFSSAHVDLMHGVVPHKGTAPEGPGLADALHTALGKTWTDEAFEDFGAYLAGRRLIAEWSRYEAGKLEREPHWIPKDVWEQAVVDFEAANPSWADAAKQVYEWNANHWKKQYDAGFLSQEAYQLGLTEHEDYVPLMRDLSDKEPFVGKGGGGRNRKFAGGPKTFRGSTRDIINPIQSMMQRAYNLSALTARNEALSALFNLAQRAGRFGGSIVEQLPAHEIQKVNVDVMDALTKAIDNANVSKRDADLLLETIEAMLGEDTTVGVFKAGEINERGEPIVFLWKEGRKIPLRLPDGEFGKQMFEAVTGMNATAKNLFVNIASAPSQVLRFGITTHPEFFFANYIRDQIATWITSDVGFVPGVTGARGIADELAQTKAARLYNVAGGLAGGANVASLDKARVMKDMAALNKKGITLKRFLSPRQLIKASEISETGTRMGVFRLAYDKARKAGMSEYEAMQEAHFASRDILDFDRRGSHMLSAIRTVTFLNASLQGLDKARRVLTAEGEAGRSIRELVAPLFGQQAQKLTPAQQRRITHAAKAWAKVSAIGAFGLALTAAYKDDPEYEEISDYLRATHWMVKLAPGKWGAVPKPFELATLSNVLERGYEATAKKDPKAWERLWAGLGEVLAPPLGITALAVPFDLARNRTSTGQPIIPDHLRYGTEPEMQFNSYTSELSKRLGKAVHASPAVMDYVITGFGGSWGRSFLGATDAVLKEGGDVRGTDAADAFIARRFVRDVTRGSVSSKEFWGLVSQSGGSLPPKVGMFRDKVKAGDIAGATAYLDKLKPIERSYVVASTGLSGRAEQMHPVIRAEKAVRAITDLRRELSRGPIRVIGGETVTLTPGERNRVDQALATMSMAEMRDALILADDKGWAQKSQMRSEADAAQAQLKAADPRIEQLYKAFLFRENVMPRAEMEQRWAEGRERLMSPGAAQIAARVILKNQDRGRDGTVERARRGAAPAVR
jgi:hypothetical protein